MSQTEHGLRLLSIDGGGIRGLSSLLILREVLYRMRQAQNLTEIPRPSEVFDLAGGTSLGGLIVIMLFRLGMSIDEAIDAYTVLAKRVFSKKKRLPLREGMFKATLLEEAVLDIIQSGLKLDRNEAKSLNMLDEKVVKCFVCAVPAGHVAQPTLFRSWAASKNPTFDCTIVEAVRATSADPTLFKGIDIGEQNLKARYLDGGLRCNNPVRYVLQEGQSLFPGRPISCILSIGTGTANVISLQSSDTFRKIFPMKLINVLKRIATDCENTSEETANQSPSMQDIYFRLNVDQGLQAVSLAEWERLGEVKTHTEKYLLRYDVNRKVSRLVDVLDRKIETETLPTIDLSPSERQAFDKLEKSITVSAYSDSRALSTVPGCLPGTRKGQIESILQWIEMDSQEKPLFVVMGPAGSGKSSLLVTIAQICDIRRYHAGSFFFSCTDTERHSEARMANTIAYQIAIAIPEFQPYVARVVAADPTILSPSRSFQSQMGTLLVQPFSQFRLDYPEFVFQPRVLIIDALDECGIAKDQLRVIETLSEALSCKSFPFLCILSSRFDLHIQNAMFHKRTQPLIYDQVTLGEAVNAEMADILSFVQAGVGRIREEHPFRKRIPDGWPALSDLEAIAYRSGGQFIYAATAVRYIASPRHNRLHDILSIDSSMTKAAGPFTALDRLYRTLMSSIESEYLAVAIEILGIELVRKSSQFWTPETLEWEGFFAKHFDSLDADIILAPLAPVLRCENNVILFHHLTFAEFLLDATRSGQFFVQPSNWHKWIVSQLVPFFADNEDIYDTDVEYLIREAKPETELHMFINEGFELIGRHHPDMLVRSNLNLWPFATFAFLRLLQARIGVDDIVNVFAQRGESFLPLPVLIKLAPVHKLTNSFLLFELCRVCAELKKRKVISDYSYAITPHRLLLFMSYLSEFFVDQHCPERYHLSEDYASATIRCLWYLQSPSSDVRFSLKEQVRSLKELLSDFGVPGYLDDTSNNITYGALEVLPSLLFNSHISTDLLATLKRPFDGEVMLRTPSSSHKAINTIHNYLVQHDEEHVLTEETAVGNDELQPDFYAFLHLDSSLPSYDWSDSDSESADSHLQLLTDSTG